MPEIGSEEGLAGARAPGLKRRILASAAPVAVFTGLYYVVEALKQMLLARWFGRTDEIEAFMIGSLVPVYLPAVATAPIALVLIPALVGARAAGADGAANPLLSRFLAYQLASLTIALIIVVILAEPIVALSGNGFGPAKRQLAQQVLIALLPLLLLAGWSKTLAAALNAERRFALAAATPILVPACGLVSLALFRDSYGITAMAGGMVAGAVAQLILLAVAARRAGFRVLPGGVAASAPARQGIGHSYAVLLGGTLAMTSIEFVDNAMAASLGPGSVAAFNYGRSIVTVLVGVASLSLGTAILPHIAHELEAGHGETVRAAFRGYMRLTVVVGALASAAMVAFSEPLIAAVFEYGAFTGEDTGVVAAVQALFALQIPWYVAGGIAVRVISALRMNRVILVVAVANLVLDVALNWLFMRSLGVAGIALATSCVFLFSFLSCWLYAERGLARHIANGTR